MQNEIPKKSEKNFVGCVVNATIWSIPVQVRRTVLYRILIFETKKRVYYVRTGVMGLSSVVSVEVPSIALSSV
jgi:hypothetical protein